MSIMQANDRGDEAKATLLTEHMAKQFAVSTSVDRLAELIRAGDEQGLLEHLQRHPEALHLGDRRSDTCI